MEIGKIITLDDNKNYLLLEKVDIAEKNYLYMVEVDKEDMPTTQYHYFELIHENDGDYTEEVEDKDIIEAISSLLTIKYLNDVNKNEEQAA